MDAEYLKKQYDLLDDNELIRLEKTDLIPAARTLLIEEIERRKIDLTLAQRGTSLGSESDSQNDESARESPNWSKNIQMYALFAPMLILPMLGARGLIWMIVASGVGYYAALSYAVDIRKKIGQQKGRCFDLQCGMVQFC